MELNQDKTGLFVSEQLLTGGVWSARLQWAIWDFHIRSEWTKKRLESISEVYAHPRIMSRKKLFSIDLLNPWFESKVRLFLESFDSYSEFRELLSYYPEEPPLAIHRKLLPVYQEFELTMDLNPDLSPWMWYSAEKGTRVVSKPDRYGLCSPWGRMCDSYEFEGSVEVPIGCMKPVGHDNPQLYSVYF